MLDSGTKLPENRIHLFDPVGLINDGYGGYRSSNYTVRSPRKPAKSYSNFEEVNTNGGLRSYDGFTNVANNSNNGGLRSCESFSMEKNGGGVIRSYEHNNNVVDDRNSLGSLRFGVDNNVVDDDEGDVSTPRLWNNVNTKSTSPKAVESSLHPSSSNSYFHGGVKAMNSSVTSLHTTTMSNPKSGVSSPLHQYHQNMSPSSRTQAIARGRKELMEMVRGLPESFYELSLKDIVEQKAEMEVEKEVDVPEEKKTIKESSSNNGAKGKQMKKGKKSGKQVKKSESKKKMVRSKSVDHGKFLLRTSVFPIFSGGKKNKKNLAPSSSFKIAPMPKPHPNPTGPFKVGEKDWWRRKSCISSESDDTNGLSSKSSSSGSSSSSRSSSSNGRRSNRFLPSCCLFNGRRIRSKK